MYTWFQISIRNAVPHVYFNRYVDQISKKNLEENNLENQNLEKLKSRKISIPKAKISKKRNIESKNFERVTKSNKEVLNSY